jgi:hypothetical protein
MIVWVVGTEDHQSGGASGYTVMMAKPVLEDASMSLGTIKFMPFKYRNQHLHQDLPLHRGRGQLQSSAQLRRSHQEWESRIVNLAPRIW